MTNLSTSKASLATGYVAPAADLLELVNEGILCDSFEGVDVEQDATIVDMPEVDFSWNS